MKEDDYCPCQRQNAVVVVSWLRLLAYNIVSLFRSRQPARHGDKLSWERAFELLMRAFLEANSPTDSESIATLC
jgi:hypothetical protein